MAESKGCVLGEEGIAGEFRKQKWEKGMGSSRFMLILNLNIMCVVIFPCGCDQNN